MNDARLTPRARRFLPTLLALGMFGLLPSLASGCDTGQNLTDGHSDHCGELALCSGACVDLSNTPAHCGDCSTVCGDAEACTAGVCSACSAEETVCGTQGCVDTNDDATHCGSCFNTCVGGEVCTAGACTCPAGETCGQLGSGGSASASGGATSGSGGSATQSGGTGNSSGGGPSPSGGSSNSGGGPSGQPCTNILPTDTGWPEATCEDWANDGQCDAEWFEGSCEESCGKCTANGNGSGGTSSSGGGSGMGTGNPYGGVTNPEGENHATRYWDCCKPSCGWSNQGNIHSCDLSNNNVGVNDQMSSVCDGGNAQTCHGMAPWAYSSDLAFGYAAANGRDCGACYKLEFTGQGHHNAGDPGSQAIAGKVMIVKVTNRGAELGDGHFDLLIPGGGLGMFNGCTQALGIQEGELGARNGGFMTSCNGDLNCVRNSCMSTFSNHPELQAGCLWSADWFQGADNPRFRFEKTECPAELGDFN